MQSQSQSNSITLTLAFFSRETSQKSTKLFNLSHRKKLKIERSNYAK
jgi:hypothetical protein